MGEVAAQFAQGRCANPNCGHYEALHHHGGYFGYGCMGNHDPKPTGRWCQCYRFVRPSDGAIKSNIDQAFGRTGGEW
jgi:hypothetical protein